MPNPRSARRPALPCPTATQPPDWAQRLDAWTLWHQRRRAVAEGSGRDWGSGRGQDFVGYRPYRAGEDARALDFALLARSGRPFVKVTRSEAHQSVTLLLDRSASMAVGPPGKWQSAVEIALAYAYLWAALNSEVRLVCADGNGAVSVRLVRNVRDWQALSQSLFGLRAEGGSGLRETLRGLPAAQDRVIAIGDLWDLEPSDLQPRLRAQTDWTLVRVLAPDEIEPPADTPVVWLDPESSAEPLPVTSDAQRQDYRERLAAWEERWRTWSALHRVTYATHVAGRPWEEALRAIAERKGGVG